jgi:molecular chaperone DnaK (HSP70)
MENISTTIFGISEETKKEYKYVVGIDFGTTYSGVAYSDVDERDGFDAPVITPITRW